MSDKLSLYEERVRRVNDAIELREPDRVPVLSQIDNWALSYYGITLTEALNDVEQEYQAYSKSFTDFSFDGAIFGGITFPLNFVYALGGGIYNNKMDTIQIATGHAELMSADEYDLLIADPIKFIRDTLLPRKHKIFQEGTVQEKFGKYANAVSAFMQYAQTRGMLNERYKQEHGFPVFNNGACSCMATDAIMDYLRDFKGIMQDIKRCPEKVAEASDVLVDLMIKKTLGVAPQPASDRYVQLFLHLPQFIRAKEFEKVYWPSFQKYVNAITNHGHKIVILFEKNWEHLYEYIQELPKGKILGFFEEDDLRKAKKALGKTMCIAGGLMTNDLSYGTKEHCLDVVKGLIDDLAPGGGFILTTDKGLMSPNDAKPENLRAVIEFALQYGSY